MRYSVDDFKGLTKGTTHNMCKRPEQGITANVERACGNCRHYRFLYEDCRFAKGRKDQNATCRSGLFEAAGGE